MAEPKVRFKRDDGSSYPAWTIVPFSKLSVPSGIKNKNDADLESYSISNERGFVPQNEQFEEAGYLNNADRSLYYIVKPGSFAYNPARINIGSIGYQNVGKDVLVSSLYEIFNTTDELDDGFLMNWFKTEQFQKHVRRLSEGGVRQYFYYDKLCMVKFSLPCLEEQQKIADFLSSVDEVITASEEEVANLETQKKAVMKKIFSQEVRFKRTDGSDFPEWEEQPLGTIAGVYDGTHQTPEYVAEGIKFVSVENISDLYGSNKYITEDAFMKQYKNNAPQKGDVLMTRIGDIGTAALVSSDEQLAYYVSLALLKPSFVICPNYLVQAIASDFFQSELWIRTLHTAYPQKINKEDIGKCLIQIPCLEEQRLIADFLSNFDEAIAAAKKELELWKGLKKGLLQQMFV